MAIFVYYFFFHSMSNKKKIYFLFFFFKLNNIFEFIKIRIYISFPFSLQITKEIYIIFSIPFFSSLYVICYMLYAICIHFVGKYFSLQENIFLCLFFCFFFYSFFFLLSLFKCKQTDTFTNFGGGN